MRSLLFPIWASLTGLVALSDAVAAPADWHELKYLDGGGYWTGRLRVVVANDGDVPAEGVPVSVRIGRRSGEADLAGKMAEAIRVCDRAGVELLYAIYAPDGSLIKTGPIPDCSTLVIPAECPARSTFLCYVYFDNPHAREVPDHFSVRPGLINGDVECGRSDTPNGWLHDLPDERHLATWSAEQSRSGKRCLKTVVHRGAEPTWIATRQHGIHIVGGARYVMRAWVKAEGVEGFAGWYIRLGSRENPVITVPMLSAGGGSFDWKEVSTGFMAPPTADRADLGTVLRGTGVAWFDSVTLKCLDPRKLSARAERPEQRLLREVPSPAEWYQPTSAEYGLYDRRAIAKAVNSSSSAVIQGVIAVDTDLIRRRMRGQLASGSVCVTFQRQLVPAIQYGNWLLFQGEIPPETVHCYQVYFSENGPTEVESGTTQRCRPTHTHNLVKNAGFEEGDGLPDDWSAPESAESPNGITYGFDEAGRPGLGRRCVRMQGLRRDFSAFRGWRQTVPVEPGNTYLVAAWAKCRGVREGEVRLVAQCQTVGRGSPPKDLAFRTPESITDTTDWTLLSMILTVPEETSSLELGLTINTNGTVWCDEVFVGEVTQGRITALEGRPVDTVDALRVWPVPSFIKVLPDDPCPRTGLSAGISSARNERETLQLAVRGGQSFEDLRIEVVPPSGPDGSTLDAFEVNAVGNVPIDHPSGFYRYDGPAWHRMIPDQPGQSDGWPGRWPDPLLPTNELDLAPNETRAVWITFHVPKGVPAGKYRGVVRFVEDDVVCAKLPFTVRVWDFSLPDENHLAAIYDVRLGLSDESRVWGSRLEGMYPQIVRFMAERRLCPDSVRPAPVFRLEDGRVAADFAEFDRAASLYFNELKLQSSYAPWIFYAFGWGQPPQAFLGQQPYQGGPPYEGIDRGQLRPEYKNAYQACLKQFWDHVKKKGWEEKFVLNISDEPYAWHKHIRNQMKALCDMVHEIDPAIPVYSSVLRHVPDWQGYIDILGIAPDERVAPEDIDRLRRAGKRLWFTADGQMCIDTPYCAAERLLPHYCFKYGVEAYEFWGIGWLTYNPYQFGWHSYVALSAEPGEQYWMRYASGDGFLLYPGAPIGHRGLVSSIRLEQAREGVEDYEYLFLLKRLIEEGRASGQLRDNAEQVLMAASQLVTIPNHGGRFSSRLLPQPERLLETRESVAQAIEQAIRARRGGTGERE